MVKICVCLCLCECLVPDSEISLLPLELGQGAALLEHPQQCGPASAGFVQADPSGPQPAVHPADQSQHRPHLSAQGVQLGLSEPRRALVVQHREPEVSFHTETVVVITVALKLWMSSATSSLLVALDIITVLIIAMTNTIIIMR